MSLESILQHIIEEANNQREIILKEARRQAEIILKEARQQAEQESRDFWQGFNLDIERQNKKIITAANIEKKKSISEAKYSAVDEVFNTLKERLNKNTLPKKNIIWKDKSLEERLSPEEFIQRIRSSYEFEIVKMLKIDEEDL